MKKILITMAAVLMLAATLLVGCSGTPETLEGTTWEVETLESKGVDVLQAAAASGITGTISATFQDGEFTLYWMGEQNAASYTYEDGVLTIDGVSTTVKGDTIEFLNLDSSHIVMKRK
jgi:hypothetical protein